MSESASEPRIAEAVGSANTARHAVLGRRIEEAMSAAIRDALAEGIPMSDTDTIRARILAAREAVKQDFRDKK